MTYRVLNSWVMVLLFALLLCAASCSPASEPGAGGNKSGPPVYEGYLDSADCNAIVAWGWDMNRPNEPIKFDIYDGNILIATVTADEFRQDLLAAGKGNGEHNMVFIIPPKLKDGKKHIITIKYARTEIEVTGGRREITCDFEW